METQVSEFGRYQGFTGQVYDGTRRFSDYMALSDGTRVAYDLFLPTKKDEVADIALPVLFLYTPYLRVFTVFDAHGKSDLVELEDFKWYETAFLRLRSRFARDGNLMDALFRRPWLRDLVKSGYAVVVAERPGTGASFGKVDLSDAAMARESDEILDWMADQSWCDGNVGMFGDSIQAQVQFAAASTGNEHLKAILPASTWLDNYSATMWPGGVYDKAFGSFFTWSQKLLDSPLITPVDTDEGAELLAQAIAERRDATTADVARNMGPLYPFRDSLTPTGRVMWDNSSLLPMMDRINESKTPTYLVNGWYDLLARDNLLIYANLAGPKRLTVRPTDHSNIDKAGPDVDFGVEAHRWFDFWLKGIANGIMDEPPIHYCLMNDDGHPVWEATADWPDVNAATVRYFLSDDPDSGTGAPGASGKLADTTPTDKTPLGPHVIDYTTTTGTRARWTAVEQAHDYPDMRANDAKALAFTSEPLDEDTALIGHPVAHLSLCTDAPELDVFAYLEEVDGRGTSTYVTEGVLRASHRATCDPPCEYLGLPYHSHRESALEPVLAEQPMELVFDLLPTAWRFRKGDRIRLTLAFADTDNFETEPVRPAPGVSVLRNSPNESFIEVPIAHV